MIPWTIRAYDAQRDGDAAYALWQAALGDLWPTTQEAFHKVLTGYVAYADGEHFVAERGARLLGLIATQPAKPFTSSIPLIMVAPEAQRQGIGTQLLNTVLDKWRAEDRASPTYFNQGIRKGQLGAGGYSYFWPGVPENIPGALQFFARQGWKSHETAHDLVRDLSDYETPTEVTARGVQAGITMRTITGADLPAVLRFEADNFPGWTTYFLDEARALVSMYEVRDPPPAILAGRAFQPTTEHRNILAAWDAQGNVVGTLLLFTAKEGESQAKLWMPLLGDDMGGFSVVGVAEAWRDRGIGTALSARASEILKERGVRNSHIGWTWLLDFYGRLGYQPWRSYAMFTQSISEE